MNPVEFLSKLKTANLFQEVVIFVGGFGFLCMVWFFQLRFLDLKIFFGWDRLEIDSLIFISSYLIGRGVLFLAHRILVIVEHLAAYLFFPNQVNISKRFDKSEIGKKARAFWRRSFDHCSSAEIPIAVSDEKQKITAEEVYEILGKNPLYQGTMDNYSIKMILASFFACYSALGSWYANTIFLKVISLIFMIFFVFEWHLLRRDINNLWLDTQKSLVKKK